METRAKETGGGEIISVEREKVVKLSLKRINWGVFDNRLEFDSITN